MYRAIVVGHEGSIVEEANVAVAVTPGMLVDVNASGELGPQTLVGPVPAKVVEENDFFGGGLDDVIAINQQARYRHLKAGAQFMGLLAAGAAAVTNGAYLESDGAGGVRLASVQTGEFATLLVGAGNAGVNFVAKAPGSPGNDIQIAIGTPNATGSVTVAGNLITVVPDTDTPTATAVAALINATAAAAALVTATANGTGGSNVVGPVAAANLAGGVDGDPEGARYRAKQAVDNSGGATKARIRVQVER